MRYSILNTSASTYLELWNVLKEEECITDIPLDLIPDEWIFEKLDSAISLDDHQGEVPLLYDIIMREAPPVVITEGVAVTPHLSPVTAFCLNVGQTKIRFPYISYHVSIEIEKGVLSGNYR